MVAGLVLLLLAGCGAAPAAGPSPERSIVLATTTSTQDSGLLDDLLPVFTAETGWVVKPIAVGSGQAIEMGRRGEADVLLVHSPVAEERFMRDGHGASRKAVMHNDFVLVGPPSDPARVARAAGALDAMRGIARARAPFASRGDDSGTHAKELGLWHAAGIEPRGSWYIETGQGMGETLTIAGQKRAYTLSDRASFLATDHRDARILARGGGELKNPYHVIVVNARGVNTACAEAFSRWLTAPGAQRTIARFGVQEYGEPLFFPDAGR